MRLTVIYRIRFGSPRSPGPDGSRRDLCAGHSALSPTPSHTDTAEPERLPGSVHPGDEAPRAEVGRARLTAEGQFEVTVRPDDDVAGVLTLLRRLPATARFVEWFGDVDTTLAFLPTAISEPLADRVPLGHTKATGRQSLPGPLGVEHDRHIGRRRMYGRSGTLYLSASTRRR
ncbi:hypothetical protein [Pseudofrankia sp. DC12]|uniref:hypothetical protein n=1 Tax=Pseudofrankia sp. DC12 TaxID=683315 RepID=UPI0005F7E422|nr:hypothetical protein [Pseudofrankia sp. DC12]